MRALAVALLAVACAPPLPGDPNAELCLSGFDSAHAHDIIAAADEWHERTDGRAGLRLGCSSESIPVTAVPGHIDERGERACGETDGHYIKLDPFCSQWFYRTALHELGHWLTGYEHSPDERDVMHEANSSEQSGHLTDADVARFR